MEAFRRLGIIEPILQSIEEQRFERPSEIQVKSIPLTLEGRDIIAGSATGSGKTLAFGSGLIQNAEKGQGIQALVLTPTRELADQVAKEIRKFSKYKPLNVVVIVGGLSMNPQVEGLRKADIVVGTPGRLLDHIGRGTINLRNVKAIVLDEADRMCDMGFVDDVEDIILECPKERQTLLFSATICDDVNYLAKNYMEDPVRISVNNKVDPSKLAQIYYDVQDNMKFSLLVHLVKNNESGLAMVFCNSRNNTDFVSNNLRKNGIKALAIHGGYTQSKRMNIMEDFNKGKAHVLVCTDVAARGLDIKGVSHVYNYDIPKDSKEYVHRIGRTARAGEEGIAVNILSSRDHENFSRVLRDRKLNIQKENMPQVEKVRIVIQDRDRRGGGFRGRPGRDSRGGRGGRDSRGGPRRDSRGPRRDSRDGPRRDSRSGNSRGGPRRDSRDSGRSRHRSGPRR